MSFDNHKKLALSKPDNSAIGSIDKAIKPLCDLINASDNYFTTSSCSGRIVVMSEPEDHRKNEAQWLFVTHEQTDFNTVQSRITPLPRDEIWLRAEGIILHVACRTHRDAFTLVSAAREAGLKRSGVISSRNKTIVEIIDTETLELPIAVEGTLLVSEEYLTRVLEIASKKLERTRKKMKRLQKRLYRLFSSSHPSRTQ
jgi:tRNA wybutosine-synthesizing protein 3